jgi:hypothetical protein
MRRLFEGRAGMALAFILGLVIATGATAGATSLITGGQIKNGTISAKDLSKALRKKLARARVPGPKGVPGPQGAKGDQGPAAGQVVAAVGASLVSTTACANTTLTTASFTLSAPAQLLVVFGGAWVYAPQSGRVGAKLVLTSQGQQVGAGGPDVNHQSPFTMEGQADWTGFIHGITGTFQASLLPAGTYSLTATPTELNIVCTSAGQWSGVSMTVIAVRPAP